MNYLADYLVRKAIGLYNRGLNKKIDSVYENLLERAIDDGLTPTHSGHYIKTIVGNNNPSEGFISPFILAQETREVPSEEELIKDGKVYEGINPRNIIVSDFGGILNNFSVEFEKEYPANSRRVFKGKIRYKGKRDDEKNPFVGTWEILNNEEMLVGNFELRQVFGKRSPNYEYFQSRLEYWMKRLYQQDSLLVAFTRERGPAFRNLTGALEKFSLKDQAKVHAKRYLNSPLSKMVTQEELEEEMRRLTYFDDKGKPIKDSYEHLKIKKRLETKPTDDNFGGDSTYKSIDNLPDNVLLDPKVAAGIGIINGYLSLYAFCAMDTANDEARHRFRNQEEANKWVAENIIKEEERLIKRVSRFYSITEENYEEKLRKFLGEVKDLGSPEEVINNIELR